MLVWTDRSGSARAPLEHILNTSYVAAWKVSLFSLSTFFLFFYFFNALKSSLTLDLRELLSQLIHRKPFTEEVLSLFPLFIHLQPIQEVLAPVYLYLISINITWLFSLDLSPGIFAYLNYRVPRTRKEIFNTLVKGLQRLEYRGYDSAGEPAPPSSLNVMAVCSAGNRYDSELNRGCVSCAVGSKEAQVLIDPPAPPLLNKKK